MRRRNSSRSKETQSVVPVMMSKDQVVNYLRDHPEVLEKFVATNVDIETIQNWLNKKQQQQISRSKSTGMLT